LWRQEGAKKQREEQAEELFLLAVEEGRVSGACPATREANFVISTSSLSGCLLLTHFELKNNRAKNLLPLWGPDDSFHINPMLLNHIIKSSYFQKCCRDITDWSALVDEIYYQVKHLEPWAIGTFGVSNDCSFDDNVSPSKSLINSHVLWGQFFRVHAGT
jgi:pre-mRNA-splicing factor 38B